MALALAAGACLDPLLAVATGSTAIGALGYVVLAAGFAAASVALLRTSDSRFDLLLGTTAGVAPLVVAVLRFLMPYDTVDMPYDTVDDPATAASKSMTASPTSSSAANRAAPSR
jgi:hypothetical protein